MARSTPEKEPGRLKQMWQVFQMTRRSDPGITWYLILSFLVPVAVSIVVSVAFFGGNVIGMILIIVTGVLLGALLVLVVLGRRAERAAYSQISGQPGAVGAVIKNGLRRSWVGSEEPVAFSAKTRDAVYRAVGRPGVVLIGEGPRSRTQPMLDKERAAVSRLLPNVPVHVLYVGPDQGSVPLHRISAALGKFPRKLTKAEVLQVDKRLTSVAKVKGFKIPGGIDPQRMRAPRPR
ncbi:DUF4191 domain-containing protein [Protaetiibacter mangrovi]|uniref:DUF4191 domain-containing protein n=1 Tax=Protaetiibacter mangrovi TaxID=2970926 RepID=A0ABT1ZBP5_9MICO|nr:DUF4191 domain-containing protein [Protaetiibacter mangrovi]MCS0498119.1 DUF4191 domain-containing protein [Protaetiibacter mangrovi]TPX05219.1 DUF4191 family protein [Schumannella luteola]